MREEDMRRARAAAEEDNQDDSTGAVWFGVLALGGMFAYMAWEKLAEFVNSMPWLTTFSKWVWSLFF